MRDHLLGTHGKMVPESALKCIRQMSVDSFKGFTKKTKYIWVNANEIQNGNIPAIVKKDTQKGYQMTVEPDPSMDANDDRTRRWMCEQCNLNFATLIKHVEHMKIVHNLVQLKLKKTKDFLCEQ